MHKKLSWLFLGFAALCVGDGALMAYGRFAPDSDVMQTGVGLLLLSGYWMTVIAFKLREL